MESLIADWKRKRNADTDQLAMIESGRLVYAPISAATLREWIRENEELIAEYSR